MPHTPFKRVEFSAHFSAYIPEAYPDMKAILISFKTATPEEVLLVFPAETKTLTGISYMFEPEALVCYML